RRLRHRRGDRAGAPRPPLRPLLHHEARGERPRARVGRLARPPAPRRRPCDLTPRGRIDAVRGLAAGGLTSSLRRRLSAPSVLRFPPAAEDQAAERKAEAERADGEAADGDALTPRREALPAAERLFLVRRERLAAAALAQRAAGADAEVEVVEDLAAVFVRHRAHCSLLRPCQHASSMSLTCISGRGGPFMSPRSRERSRSSWRGSTRRSCSPRAT